MGGGASTENKNSPDLLGDPPKCRWETNRRYGAFLSHFKAEAAIEARYLKELLQRMFGGKTRCFLDSANLIDLRELFSEGVERSDCIVMLGTRGVLLRGACLLEVWAAHKANIPVLMLRIEGRGFDAESALFFLRDLPDSLAEANPHALRQVQEFISAEGVSMEDFKTGLVECLSDTLGFDTGLTFTGAGTDQLILAEAVFLVEEMASHTGRKITWDKKIHQRRGDIGAVNDMSGMSGGKHASGRLMLDPSRQSGSARPSGSGTQRPLDLASSAMGRSSALRPSRISDGAENANAPAASSGLSVKSLTGAALSRASRIAGANVRIALPAGIRQKSNTDYLFSFCFDRGDLAAADACKGLATRLVERTERPVFLDEKKIQGYSRGGKSSSAAAAMSSVITNRLEQCVRSEAVLFLQSSKVLFHGSVLLELYWAARAHVPIIPMRIAGYEFEQAKKTLENLSTALEPEAFRDVQATCLEHRVPLCRLQQVLADCVTNVISLPLNTDASEVMWQGHVQDVLLRLSEAKTRMQRKQSAMTVQSTYRAHHAVGEFQTLKRAVVKLQAFRRASTVRSALGTREGADGEPCKRVSVLGGSRMLRSSTGVEPPEATE